nr:DUF2516 family protein [Psychromicrobium silvestre]
MISYWIMLLAGLIALAVQIWAVADCLMAKPSDFERADKRSKGFWLAITVASAIMGLLYLIAPIPSFSTLLEVAACVAAGVYLADVRPTLRQVRRGGNRPMGPYGPW